MPLARLLLTVTLAIRIAKRFYNLRPGAGYSFGQQRCIFRGNEWPAKKVALSFFTLPILEKSELSRLLDALSYDPLIKATSHRNDRAHYDVIPAMDIDILHE